MMRLRDQPAAEAGFTIVELMIATMVFSVILIVITVGVISFTNAYYKGLNSANTQTVARSITDDVSQAIQFGSGAVIPTPATNPTTYCIGTIQYDYSVGTQVSSTGHGLWVSPRSTDSPCSSAPATNPTSREMLGNHMRVAVFSVTPNGALTNLYTVHVSVAYGDNDLLCAPASQPGSCARSAATLSDANLSVPDITCKPGTGSQFCAVSTLTTSVQKRVQ